MMVLADIDSKVKRIVSYRIVSYRLSLDRETIKIRGVVSAERVPLWRNRLVEIS